MGSSMITMTMKMLTKYTDVKGITKQASSVKVDRIHLVQKAYQFQTKQYLKTMLLSSN